MASIADELRAVMDQVDATLGRNLARKDCTICAGWKRAVVVHQDNPFVNTIRLKANAAGMHVSTSGYVPLDAAFIVQCPMCNDL